MPDVIKMIRNVGDGVLLTVGRALMVGAISVAIIIYDLKVRFNDLRKGS